MVEPDMDAEEYARYRAAWRKAFPCECEDICLCRGPPEPQPRRPRVIVILPDEPPAISPAAAKVLRRILQKAIALRSLDPRVG